MFFHARFGLLILFVLCQVLIAVACSHCDVLVVVVVVVVRGTGVGVEAQLVPVVHQSSCIRCGSEKQMSTDMMPSCFIVGIVPTFTPSLFQWPAPHTFAYTRNRAVCSKIQSGFLMSVSLIIIIQEIYRASTLWLKALNNTD